LIAAPALPKGELTTLVTNKQMKGKKGIILASFASRKVQPNIDRSLQIPYSKNLKAKEITLDRA